LFRSARRLSADVINFSARGSSVAKGEGLKDTALTLQAMGADAVVVRHSASGAAHRLAGWVDGAVVNAGDGTHEHPTQALLDAFTIRRHVPPRTDSGGGVGPGADRAGGTGPGAEATTAATGRALDGVRVAIVGDVLHSRVARSNGRLLHLLGAEVTLVAPPTLLPVGMEAWPCRTSYHLDEVLADHQPDAIMMLRIQRE